MTQAKEIGIFGDSLSQGVILDPVKNTFKIIKESFAGLLKRASTGAINNFARFGCTIERGFEIVKKHIPDISNFDTTILEFGGNDSDFDWAAISQNPEIEHLPKTTPEKFEELYAQTIDIVRETGSKPVMLNLPPIDPFKYFKKITDALSAENILKWLGSIGVIYAHHELYNSIVTKLAAKEKIPLIDIRTAFLKQKNYSALLCEDGIHPNEMGHRVIFEQIRCAV
jgi:lysophospholipase L1-like esterase